ncbi:MULTISPECIES: PilW family protein [unclassified Acinetobacter]|uniref:PilW family protein n=1 Tax=unclassified Acinetobacter TaxID=196816 RepID=UPI0024475EFE|nr:MULTISPECIES: PilW family protein [unclassified Acinetobacter]MDH0029833.1 PilW family protein [Acinetobacter sp. GD04021]MDH0885403.1 PilW family protein [Acinetobacter sp. GD03873]MDH1081521.1 PilW family protein [Acinetobacter sp. GD03983]MDH2188698.1 PilW family protein [Acinetobacter sp. GD03645]MDH2203421.1 PilW family protein [Acinetobacter sp. GD03647]
MKTPYTVFHRSMQQQGFTLIELMVALALGLVITAAAIQLFTGGLLSSRMQEANAELQNSGVFGLDYVVRDIRLANYTNINNPALTEQTPWGGVVLTARTGAGTNVNLPIPDKAPFISNGLLTHSVGSTEAASTVKNEWRGLSNVDLSSDQLTIQFIAPNAMVNCEGANVQEGDYVIQRYFLRPADDPDSTTSTEYGLACDANTPVSSKPDPLKIVPTGFGDAGQVIMPRVDHFTIQLGTRAANGNLAYYTVNQYRTLAAAARAAAPPTVPPRIVSVKLGVLVRSVDNTRNSAIDPTQKIDILNQKVELKDKDTKYARRVYSTTVALRNGLGERL